MTDDVRKKIKRIAHKAFRDEISDNKALQSIYAITDDDSEWEDEEEDEDGDEDEDEDEDGEDDEDDEDESLLDTILDMLPDNPDEK